MDSRGWTEAITFRLASMACWAKWPWLYLGEHGFGEAEGCNVGWLVGWFFFFFGRGRTDGLVGS